MLRMKNAFMSILVVLSMLFAPVAHAADAHCKGFSCTENEQIQKQAEDSKQDSSKMAGACHHCCNMHVAIKLDVYTSEHELAARQPVVVANDEKIVSLVVGPPLKPPSHA